MAKTFRSVNHSRLTVKHVKPEFDSKFKTAPKTTYRQSNPILPISTEYSSTKTATIVFSTAREAARGSLLPWEKLDNRATWVCVMYIARLVHPLPVLLLLLLSTSPALKNWSAILLCCLLLVAFYWCSPSTDAKHKHSLLTEYHKHVLKHVCDIQHQQYIHTAST